MYITRNMNINKQRQYNIKQKNTTQHRIESFNLLLKVQVQVLLDHRYARVYNMSLQQHRKYIRL
jgi:hypothetical protein